MKKIFSLLLSFNLMVIPVVGFGAEGDQFRKESSSNMSGMDVYLKQFLMMANAGVGVSIVIGCPQLFTYTMSTPIYAAGSGIYFASELLGAKSQSEFHEKSSSDMEMVEEKMKNGGEVQKEALVKALENERHNLKYTKQRKMWATAASVAYTAATAMAIYEEVNLVEWAVSTIILQCLPTTMIPASLASKTALIAGFAAGGVGLGSGAGFGGSFAAGLGAAWATSVGASTMLTTPTTRAILFGLSTGVSLVVVAGLSKREQVAEKNVAMLEKALAQFDSETQTNKGLNTENDPVKLEQERKKFAIQELAKKQQQRNCWTQDGKSMNFSNPNCSNAMRITKPTFPPNFNVPTLAAAAANGVDMANAIASGDTARADILAGQLASQAARVNQIKEDLLKKMNDDLVSKGKKPLNLEAEVNKKLASSMNDFNNNLASKGINLNSQPSGEAKLQALDKKDQSIIASDNKTDEKNNSSSDSAQPSNGFTESPSNNQTSDNQSAILAETMKTEFEIQQNDISKESQASIFQQLSNRYILNYTKFFNENKKPSLEKK